MVSHLLPAFDAFDDSWARRARGLAIRHSPSRVVQAARRGCYDPQLAFKVMPNVYRHHDAIVPTSTVSPRRQVLRGGRAERRAHGFEARGACVPPVGATHVTGRSRRAVNAIMLRVPHGMHYLHVAKRNAAHDTSLDDRPFQHR